MWKDGCALISIGGATISLNHSDAAILARDLAYDQKRARTGYPVPATAKTGEYVIAVVARLATENPIVEIARVSSYNTRLGLYEYSDTRTISLTPAERDTLVNQLNGGAK
jgi:exosome complex RNA-binding protein Csl4